MDIKQLEADYQTFVDACNKLRNSASAIWKTEMAEDPKATNDFSEEYSITRARYLDNVANIAGCARMLRDGVLARSMKQSLYEIKEHLSVTAK